MRDDNQSSRAMITHAPEVHDPSRPAELPMSLLQGETKGRSVPPVSEEPSSSSLVDNEEGPQSFTTLSRVLHEVHSPPYSEPAWSEAYVRHRLFLRDFLRCRLFSPWGFPEIFSDRVVGAVLDKHLVCYPIRVSNIASPFTIRDMLAVIVANKWGAVLAISSHVQPDATISMDVGFRHVEDALLMWCRPGVQFDQRPWVFETLTRVAGDVATLPVAGIPPRSSKDRLQRFLACLE
jgi:hypothetical protein